MRGEKEMGALLEGIKAAGGQALAVRCDVRDRAQVRWARRRPAPHAKCMLLHADARLQRVVGCEAGPSVPECYGVGRTHVLYSHEPCSRPNPCPPPTSTPRAGGCRGEAGGGPVWPPGLYGGQRRWVTSVPGLDRMLHVSQLRERLDAQLLRALTCAPASGPLHLPASFCLLHPGLPGPPCRHPGQPMPRRAGA